MLLFLKYHLVNFNSILSESFIFIIVSFNEKYLEIILFFLLEIRKIK